MSTPTYNRVQAEHMARKVAASRYRQVRLTFTQERSGRLSYSIYAKGLNEAWDEHKCLVRDTAEPPVQPLVTTEDVVSYLLVILRDQLLPGID